MPEARHRAGPVAHRRVRFVIAYDGRPFAGWQSQVRGDTIQDRIEGALAQVVGEKVRLHGAGRTDAGVHALGQCAHADVRTKLSPATLRTAINACLPPTIRILRTYFVAPTFHARFDARGKVYRYRIATTPVLSPFEFGRAWHVVAPLEDELLRACAREFLGEHDFAGFAANRGHAVASTRRTMRKVRVQRSASITTIEFEGDGFLYKMARLMTGAIVRCAIGRTPLEEVRERLHHPAAAGPRERFVAPAAGLVLVRVQY